ncbi:hypothetical protein PVAND_016300 [Polypedilum vanderplanki]|uniref:Uncharacterized protein n=1 Tax=Polypedilum vanderplanki TaxID=319348 RepID=A0A9J6BFH7_POLVA|nr:hypothetical protein PVAND_016300 [Polypedilum vanderplanki]
MDKAGDENEKIASFITEQLEMNAAIGNTIDKIDDEKQDKIAFIDRKIEIKAAAEIGDLKNIDLDNVGEPKDTVSGVKLEDLNHITKQSLDEVKNTLEFMKDVGITIKEPKEIAGEKIEETQEETKKTSNGHLGDFKDLTNQNLDEIKHTMKNDYENFKNQARKRIEEIPEI